MSRPPADTPLLTIRIKGAAVGRGRISVDRLVRILTEFPKAVYRSGKFLEKEGTSHTRGLRNRTLREKAALDVVMYKEGSRVLVIGFDKSSPEIAAPGFDPTVSLLESAMDGLAAAQRAGEDLPGNMDLGVLLAWKELGSLFANGVSEMKFDLRRETGISSSTFTPEGFHILQEKIKGPTTNVMAIEGRLLMADFKEQGTRCRIHPESGQPILCLFTEDQAEDVLENILHYVKIVGDAKINPETDQIQSIRIIDIERLEDDEHKELDLLPIGSPVSSEFWVTQSFEDLVRAQGVSLLSDPSQLFGTWPGGPDDNFEILISELRRVPHNSKGK